MGMLLTNGLTLLNKELKQQDVLIEGNRIVEIGESIDSSDHAVIDLEGKLLAPGLVDLHIHLREPGGEHKETIKTGTQAAAKGGFTTVAAMPNTNPIPDSVEAVDDLMRRIEKDAAVRVLPYGSITAGLKGETVNDLAALKQAGAFAFTDDGVGVQTAGKMLEAMQKAAKEDVAIVAHCEDNSLVFGGSVHDGEFARKNGLKGIPNIAESVQIARDVLLAEAADCHYHVCHVSTKESVRVIRDAKRAGIRVTAEVSPHHLLLADTDIPSIDTDYKMNPPLRGVEDREALIEGLLDGTLDFIATDHAPHAASEKALPIEKAPFGIVGLETAFPLLYTHLVKKGVLSLSELLERMTNKPAEAFHLPYGKIEIGGEADLVVIDLEETQTVDPAHFLSKGKNTPFAGWELEGWPTLTIYQGDIVWEKGRVSV
ncbi:dihydroorotase [Pullulanibacillus sp. KACC 23026]|uniref:dihydroorotase n=1 Tax=Pullulanibacillus sp. KACC 23026 TaxID=3028315 RepID=UPI0023AF218C|nr:dihydroorotase [Pullulanibacillus sp. KACC 23026]WEG11641.1 dihydroorotase [Pullulanibacillus sp. KACC 23026]